jgi:hypothetical protein
MLYDYLRLWLNGINYNKYYELRNAYTIQIEDLRHKVRIYQMSGPKDPGPVKVVITKIEKQVLKGIFGGNMFKVD